MMFQLLMKDCKDKHFILWIT